jgi:hypothetical protein
MMRLILAGLYVQTHYRNLLLASILTHYPTWNLNFALLYLYLSTVTA